VKRRIGFVLCLVGFAALILAGVLGVVHAVGTDEGLYYALQMRAHVLDHAGISDEDLVRVDAALAECLKGDADALDFEIEVFGQVQPVFNEKELIHMEDCRLLFVLLRRVLVSALALAVVGIGAGAWWLRDRRKIRLAGWLAPLLIVVPLGAFAAWAVCDFNSAFNFFHEVLFTNDLWLLDYRTDLLIRLCPSSMFMNMGARIGIDSLVWVLLILIFTTVFTTVKKERR